MFFKTLGQFLSIFERAVARKRVPPRVIYQDDTGLSAPCAFVSDVLMTPWGSNSQPLCGRIFVIYSRGITTYKTFVFDSYLWKPSRESAEFWKKSLFFGSRKRKRFASRFRVFLFRRPLRNGFKKVNPWVYLNDVMFTSWSVSGHVLSWSVFKNLEFGVGSSRFYTQKRRSNSSPATQFTKVFEVCR